MQKGYFVDMLKHKPLLFEAIFNSNIIDTQKFFENLKLEENQDFFKELIQNKKVRKLFTNSLDLSNLQYWDYADESKRLALLDDQKLIDLAFIFGVALHAQEIAQTIEGKTVLEFKESLGTNIYNYAILRGQYQLSSVRKYFAQKDLEYTIAQRAKMHGFQSIKAIAVNWSNPFLLDKLKTLEENLFINEDYQLNDLELDSKAINEIYFALKKILIKEIEPKWQAYLD